MRIYLLLLGLMQYNVLLCYRTVINLPTARQEQYQDIIVNNVVMSKGIRACDSRYRALQHHVLNLYKRPITVLDIGAAQGYFSFRIAHDYPATCVMIEGNYNERFHTADQLLELCKLNTHLHSIIFLRKKITPAELEVLGKCEHFDIVLAFNIIHHFGHEWQRAAQAILNLGDNIIIETPSAQDAIALNNSYVAPLEKFLLAQNGVTIAQTSRHTDPTAKAKMLWFKQNRNYLQKSYWFAHEHSPANTPFIIESNFVTKMFFKKKMNKRYIWHQGINLFTFKVLGGIFPVQQTIYEKLLQFSGIQHGDLLPWNIIIQGEDLVLIDYDDPRWHLDSYKCLQFTIQLIIRILTYQDLKDLLGPQWHAQVQRLK